MKIKKKSCIEPDTGVGQGKPRGDTVASPFYLEPLWLKLQPQYHSGGTTHITNPLCDLYASPFIGTIVVLYLYHHHKIRMETLIIKSG